MIILLNEMLLIIPRHVLELFFWFVLVCIFCGENRIMKCHVFLTSFRKSEACFGLLLGWTAGCDLLFLCMYCVNQDLSYAGENTGN